MATSSRAVRSTILSLRQRPSLHIQSRHIHQRTFATTRPVLSNDGPRIPGQGESATGPNMQQQEHVSEEAAKVAHITGASGPDLSQGTPVQDILKNDPEAQKTAPKVLKDAIKNNIPAPKPQTRPFSTLARRMQQPSPSSAGVPLPPSMIPGFSSPVQSHVHQTNPSSVTATTAVDADLPTLPSSGHKFDLPTLPIPATHRKDTRYAPIVELFTNLMMKHGRKILAQRMMKNILTYLQTSPPPVYSTTKRLPPGAPPASALPLDPVAYLTLAVDAIAPLIRMRALRGAAGGGVSLLIPQGLKQRQRWRKAICWIIEAAANKPSRGSGKRYQGQRVAEEIVAVVEGRSACWEKRTQLHRSATTARVNINYKPMRKR